MIAVRSWERAKGLTRIEWVAGTRALADYRRANQTARAVSAHFSCARDDAPTLVEKIVDENKELHRRVRALEEVSAKVEADELLAGDAHESRRVVIRIFDNRDAESLRRLASALIEHERTIALLGSREKESARLVFARSVDESADMNQLMRDACAMIDGRGGGKPDLAQGGGRNTDKLEVAIQQAAESLKAGA